MCFVVWVQVVARLKVLNDLFTVHVAGGNVKMTIKLIYFYFYLKKATKNIGNNSKRFTQFTWLQTIWTNKNRSLTRAQIVP